MRGKPGGKVWKFSGVATVDGEMACETEFTAMMDLPRSKLYGDFRSGEGAPFGIVEEGAEIAAGCVVGPFCYVDAQVVLHPGVELKSHVVVKGDTEIGADSVVFRLRLSERSRRTLSSMANIRGL